MNELTPVAPTGLAHKAANAQVSFNEWQLLKDQAKILMDSQFLPTSIKTPQQAMIVGLAGRELGLPLMTSLRAINVINNRPSPSAQLKLALALRTKLLEDLKIERYTNGCTVHIKRKGWTTPVVASFTEADAKAMGISMRDQYHKQPQTMYQWRAIDKALNVAFADVVLGLDDENGIKEDIDIPSEEENIVASSNENQRREETVDKTIRVDGEVSERTPQPEGSPRNKANTITNSIIEMLAKMNGDNLEAMDNHLKDITMYNDRWVTTENLDEIAIKNPKRLFMIHKNVESAYQKFQAQNH